MSQTQQTETTLAEPQSSPSLVEFVVILSMMMSLVALSIDSVLPALGVISLDLGVANPNDRQLVVSIIFLGTAFGQLFLGPLSDTTGRKIAVYVGFSLFLAGSVVAMLAVSFSMLLVGRVMQGLGISAAQAVSLALVRDQYEGRRMARIMSFVMTVFILVPMIAPTIGQGILALAGWRGIFGSFLVFGLITVIWFGVRIPETLTPEARVPFSLNRILNAFKEIFTIRQTVGCAITAGLINGVFIGYLNSSQQIFQEKYALGEWFPLFFAINSLALGMASLSNTRLVMRFGMRQLVRWALGVEFILAAIFTGVTLAFAGHPPLWSLMAFLMLAFFCHGILFGNLNSMAMQPLGHLAGVGAAAIGFFSTLLSMLLGTLIGRSYDGTVLPLVAGMVILAGIANFVIRWAVSERDIISEQSAPSV